MTVLLCKCIHLPLWKYSAPVAAASFSVSWRSCSAFGRSCMWSRCYILRGSLQPLSVHAQRPNSERFLLRFFFVALLSAAIGVLLLVVVILFIFIQHYLDPSSLRTSQQFHGESASSVGLSARERKTEENAANRCMSAFFSVLQVLWPTTRGWCFCLSPP